VEVLDELRTLPLFSPVRVVLIKDAEAFIKANNELLEKYLDNPSPSGVLILTAEAWDKRLKFSKKVASSDCAQLIEVEQIKRYQLAGYAADYARSRHSVKLDRDSAELLVELTGDDPGRILRQVDNLALYVHPARAICVKDVENLVGRDRMFNAFEVIDAVCQGRCGQAIDRLRLMFEQNKDSEYTVVGAFAFHFRRLFRARALVDKGQSPAQAAQALGVRWYKERFFEQVKAMGLKQGAAALCELGGIDFGIKTGRTRASVAMERLIIQLAEIFQKQTGRVGHV